jgi:hypothetical protein
MLDQNDVQYVVYEKNCFQNGITLRNNILSTSLFVDDTINA